MKNNADKWVWIAYGCAWIATGAAVAVGIYFTQNPWCLAAFFFPAVIRIRTEDHGGKRDD